MTPHSSLPLVWTHCLLACLCLNCLLNLYYPNIGRIFFTCLWECLAWVLAIYPCSLILAKSSGVYIVPLNVFFPKSFYLGNILAWILSSSLIWLLSFPLGVWNHLGKWGTWYIIWNDDGKVPCHDLDLFRTSCIASLLCKIMPLVGFSRWFVCLLMCMSFLHMLLVVAMSVASSWLWYTNRYNSCSSLQVLISSCRPIVVHSSDLMKFNLP